MTTRMRKPGSLTYLRQLSNLILSYQEKWRGLDEQKIELSSSDENKREAHWKRIVDLAQQIHDDLGVPTKD